MQNVTVQSRVNPELRDSAAALFSGMGMSTADAIRIFLQQSVNEGGLPFRPHLKEPNEATLEAIKELEEGNGVRHNSLQEMYDDLGI